jgi:hypothetical protein
MEVVVTVAEDDVVDVLVLVALVVVTVCETIVAVVELADDEVTVVAVRVVSDFVVLDTVVSVVKVVTVEYSHIPHRNLHAFANFGEMAHSATISTSLASSHSVSSKTPLQVGLVDVDDVVVLMDDIVLDVAVDVVDVTAVVEDTVVGVVAVRDTVVAVECVTVIVDVVMQTPHRLGQSRVVSSPSDCVLQILTSVGQPGLSWTSSHAGVVAVGVVGVVVLIMQTPHTLGHEANINTPRIPLSQRSFAWSPAGQSFESGTPPAQPNAEATAVEEITAIEGVKVAVAVTVIDAPNVVAVIL